MWIDDRAVNREELTPHEWLAKAETAVGHRFANRSLLVLALTHPSSGSSSGASSSYERLEFLGDAVLGLIAAEELYRRHPAVSEGALTKLKATVVSHRALADAAEKLGFALLLDFGATPREDVDRSLPSALEDAFEAVVAALYLDAGIDAARRFVLSSLGDRFSSEACESVVIEHPKSRLQELAQAKGVAPEYRIVSFEGPPHARRFFAEVTLCGRVVGAGSGASKREAETRAAAAALETAEYQD